MFELRVLETGKSKTNRLGIRFFDLALAAFASMDLRREAEPIRSFRRTEFNVRRVGFMATDDGNDIVYLDQVMGPSLVAAPQGA